MGSELVGLLTHLLAVIGAISLFDVLVVATLAYRRGLFTAGASDRDPEPKVLREAREIVNYLHV